MRQIDSRSRRHRDRDHYRSDSIPESPHTGPIPRDASWALAEGRRGGRPYVARLRTDLKPLAGHPDYPVRLLTTWRIRPATAGGLPSVEEEEAMADFESLLVPRLSASGVAVLTAVLTHNGERSWLFYARDLDQAQHSLDVLAADFPISFVTEPDPAWERYLGVMRDLGLG